MAFGKLYSYKVTSLCIIVSPQFVTLILFHGAG